MHGDAAHVGVGDVDDGFAACDVGVIDQVGDGIDGACGDAGLFEQGQVVVLIALRDEALDDFV
ncbi:hypothetical protein BOMU111920_25585 [Bordetella muralis]